MAVAEEQPVAVLLLFGLRDEPCAGAVGVEVLDEDLCVSALAILRAERVLAEVVLDCFGQQLLSFHVGSPFVCSCVRVFVRAFVRAQKPPCLAASLIRR